MNRRPRCVMPCPFINCGLETRVFCSDCITRVCCSVTYRITIKNNCSCNVKCCTLHVDLPESLAYECGTLTLIRQGVPEILPLETLRDIPIGDLDVGEEATITYQATVMNNNRYVRTRATCSCFTCNCCTPEYHVFPGNCNLLQVCDCCCRD